MGLEHPDGWFLAVQGGHNRASTYGRAETGITVQVMVPNPKSGLIEYLSSYGAPYDKVTLKGMLEDREQLLERVCTQRAPVVAKYAGILSVRWQKEIAVREQTKIVRQRLGLAESEDRKRVPLLHTGSAAICLSLYQKDPARIAGELNCTTCRLTKQKPC